MSYGVKDFFGEYILVMIVFNLDYLVNMEVILNFFFIVYVIINLLVIFINLIVKSILVMWGFD